MYITEVRMRTLVDLPEKDLKQLTELSRSRKTSRAELIRQAVAGYLVENRAAMEDSFGMWKDRAVDGMKFQQKLRDEWEG
jgi:metal-responsive CopG/Arc/MetJ family transcriptional regulator